MSILSGFRDRRARRAERKVAEREARIQDELEALGKVRARVDALLESVYGAFGSRGEQRDSAADKIAALDKIAREAGTPSRVYDDLLGNACTYASAFYRDCAAIEGRVADARYQPDHVRRVAERGRAAAGRMQHILDSLERDREP